MRAGGYGEESEREVGRSKSDEDWGRWGRSMRAGGDWEVRNGMAG